MPRRPGTPSRSAESTRAIVEDLFRHPPVNRAELEQRLEAASAPEVRRLLVERLTSAQIEGAEGDLLVHVFQILRVGSAAEELLALVADGTHDVKARALAMSVLLHENPDYGAALRNVIPENDLLELAAQPLCHAMAGVESAPEDGEQLAAALEMVPAEIRSSLFEQLERHRKKSGIPAAVAYEEVLRHKSLRALRPAILSAIVSEGGHDAIALVERLHEAESDPTARRELLGALMRLRTRSLDGHIRPLGESAAHISSCDGQGAYFVLGDRKNPDGTHTLALLCIRAAGEIRDGYILSGQPPEQVDALLNRFSVDAGTRFVKVSVEAAAPLVFSAVKQMESRGLSPPPDAVPVLRFFDRGPHPRSPVGPPGADSVRPTLTALRRLMKRDEYRRSWFVDAGDLNRAGVEPPRGRIDASFLRAATKRLARGRVLVERVVAMARHMAAFHTLSNDPEAAALCSAAADDTLRAPADSALLRVLLERFLAPPEPEDMDRGIDEDEAEPLGELLGQPERRQFLKHRFFREVTEPRGRDLAQLDLTEATLVALEQLIDELPGDERPRDESQQEAAFAIAGHFRSFITSQKKHTLPEKVVAACADVLRRECGLRKPDGDYVARGLFMSLIAFVDEVCSTCPVRCLSRPGANLAATFFSSEHPALESSGAPLELPGSERELPRET